ncbi:MAG: type IV pilus assembly protein PilM [bacterium]
MMHIKRLASCSRPASYSPIGIDLTSDSLKLMQLRRHKGDLSIAAAAHLELNVQGLNEKVLIDRLTELLARVKVKGRRAVIALPAHFITTIPIRFTLKEGEVMDQAVLREAGNYLPFSLDEGVIDYLDLPSSGQQPAQGSALLIAVRREDVLRYIEVFKRVGLVVTVIEPQYCSLFRAIRWIQEWAHEERVKEQFVFYIGENNTIVMILVDGNILIVREVPWGVRTIRMKVEKALELPWKKVERILHQYEAEFGQMDNQGNGTGTGKIGHLEVRELCQVIHEVINPTLEELCQEIQRVISYSASVVQQRVIDQALLLGEGAKVKLLVNFIHQRTGVRMKIWDESARIKELTERQPLFEVALGLALRDGRWQA